MKKKWTVGEIQSLSIVTGDPFHYTGKWEKRFDPGMQAAKADWPMMQFLQNRKSNVNAMVSTKKFPPKFLDPDFSKVLSSYSLFS